MNPRLKLGDIVISREVVQYGRLAKTTSAVPGNSGSSSGTRTRADENLVHLLQKACAQTVGEDCCVTGSILTGDRPVLIDMCR